MPKDTATAQSVDSRTSFSEGGQVIILSEPLKWTPEMPIKIKLTDFGVGKANPQKATDW